MTRAIPCTIMRGGTSKGLYFRGTDLPEDETARDRILLAAMGSPDDRQIDGLGGADPLTSKVAVVTPSSAPDIDVDYLFLQVVVNEPRIDASQNCGNILAGVGPFAIEQGWVKPQGDLTPVRIRMVNTDSVAVAAVETPGGKVRYDGTARIDGVPGTAAPVMIEFQDVAGSSCGALLPTGHERDTIEGVEVTFIDNGMPVVLIRAADLGKTGYESPDALEADTVLREKVERIRLAAGPMMNLGDVTRKNVPKMCLIAPPAHGGHVSTRTFIPHRVHKAVGVLGAVSVATACALSGSVAAGVAKLDKATNGANSIEVEHPTGFFSISAQIEIENGTPVVRRAALLRTARKLMTGEVYVSDRS